MSLSSSPRSKSHYRQLPISREEVVEIKEDAEVGVDDAVRLQIYLLVSSFFTSVGVPCIVHSRRWSLKPVRFARVYAGGTDLRVTVPSETQLDESMEAVLKTEVELNLHADDSTAADTVSAVVPHLQINSSRLHLLNVGATLARHAGYVSFYITLSAVQALQCLRKQFQQHALACCA